MKINLQHFTNLLHEKFNGMNIINEPFASYWMKSTQKIVLFLWRTALRICGFSATIKGEQVQVIEAPIFIIAPHSTFLILSLVLDG